MAMKMERQESGQYQYLVCGGDRRGGGEELEDRVSVYRSETEARTAFLRLRIDDPLRARWGQLAAVDGSGRLTVLAWFGRPSPLLKVDGIPSLGRVDDDGGGGGSR